MIDRHDSGVELFRLWIVRCSNWQPTHWNQQPPRATVERLVDEAVYSAQEAALVLEGFNGWILQELDTARGACLWAVAVPVRIRYEGDLEAGTEMGVGGLGLGEIAGGGQD
jgi:hypothetical protein